VAVGEGGRVGVLAGVSVGDVGVRVGAVPVSVGGGFSSLPGVGVGVGVKVGVGSNATGGRTTRVPSASGVKAMMKSSRIVVATVITSRSMGSMRTCKPLYSVLGSNDEAIDAAILAGGGRRIPSCAASIKHIKPINNKHRITKISRRR